MAACLWVVLVVSAGLFALKIAYVAGTALALPATQGALYVSTTRVRVRAFLDAVAMAPGQLLVDLGCGDGRVLREARRRYGVRAVGYELNLLALAKAKLLCLGVAGVAVRPGNFWRADLSGADVVFCYLFPDVMGRLAEKAAREMRPGALLVSCNFPLPGWAPERVLRPAGGRHHDPIFIYRIPGGGDG